MPLERVQTALWWSGSLVPSPAEVQRACWVLRGSRKTSLRSALSELSKELRTRARGSRENCFEQLETEMALISGTGYAKKNRVMVQIQK